MAAVRRALRDMERASCARFMGAPRVSFGRVSLGSAGSAACGGSHRPPRPAFSVLKLVVWPWPLVIHYEFPYFESFGEALDVGRASRSAGRGDRGNGLSTDGDRLCVGIGTVGACPDISGTSTSPKSPPEHQDVFATGRDHPWLVVGAYSILSRFEKDGNLLGADYVTR